MAHLGDFFIYMAAATSLASALLYLFVWRGRERFLGLARSFYHAATVLIVGALITLLYLILVHDFTVGYVFQYSSSDLPLGFLISTLWGGQEGTFLLWGAMAGVMGLIMMRSAKTFEVGNMFFLNLFLLSLLIILLKRSPFELMPVFRAEGSGLNPLLQNFWMTIHPPIMFIGFAATVIPFCFAMTALVEKRFSLWAEAAHRWTIFAWISLGVGLILGGYWAYETLGWGGFWAWDPVENSSLIPWIFLTAQIHTLFVKRQKRGLMRFSLAMVMLSFWSVLYGTFLTRSGVLADFSVHSFVDLGINQFLITGLLAFVGMGVFFLAFRWRSIKPEASFSTVNSRTYLTALGIVVLFIGGILVLLGTSAPLLTRWAENQQAVEMSFYYKTMTPVGIAIMFLITLFPAFRWNGGMSRPVVLMAGGAGLAITVTLLIGLGVTTELMYLGLFGLAASAIASNGWVLIRSLQKGKLKAGYLGHIGLAIALIGAGASAGFESKTRVELPQGQTVDSQGYRITFTNAHDYPTTARIQGFECHVLVEQDGSSFEGILAHEYSPMQESWMKKPYVENFLLSDLYLAPVDYKPGSKTDPNALILIAGQAQTIGKYALTFEEFETSSHADEGGMTAGARVKVTFDGTTETVTPQIRVTNDGMVPLAKFFDDGAGQIEIVQMMPDQSAVSVKVVGEDLPVSQMQPATLVIELSKKPLIQFFWLGCLMVFISGGLSLWQWRKRQVGGITDVSLTATVPERTSVEA